MVGRQSCFRPGRGKEETPSDLKPQDEDFRIWTCCYGIGDAGWASGMLEYVDPSCHNCNHVQCFDCPTVGRKYREEKEYPRLNNNPSHFENLEVGSIDEKLRETSKPTRKMRWINPFPKLKSLK